jgi:type I restriction enzyme, S subunit
MELKHGYKQTDAGIIPEDWALRPLLTAVHVASGQVDPKLEPYRSMVLVAPDHIESGTGRLLEKTTAADQHAISGKYLFAVGDIVYSKIRPYLRKAILATFRGLCSADMYPLQPAPDVSAGFMLATLLGHQFSRYAESVSVRSGMPKINRAELADYRVALPPTKGEQEAIAEALGDADAFIESLEQLIRKTRQLKQGAMQELLTGKNRLPGFEIKRGYQQTDVGVLPEDWQVKPLTAFISSLEAGVSVNSVDTELGSPVHDTSILKTSCVLGGMFMPQECKAIAARDIHRAKLNPRKDSIVISRMNTAALVGECGYVDRDWPHLFLPDRLWMTRHEGRQPLCVRWLAYLLSFSSFNRVIKEGATGTSGSMKNISQASLLTVHIPQPTKAEQEAIANVLSDMDEEITALDAKLTKARHLKQGMMQELLTGSIRLA